MWPWVAGTAHSNSTATSPMSQRLSQRLRGSPLSAAPAAGERGATSHAPPWGVRCEIPSPHASSPLGSVKRVGSASHPKLSSPLASASHERAPATPAVLPGREASTQQVTARTHTPWKALWASHTRSGLHPAPTRSHCRPRWQARLMSEGRQHPRCCPGGRRRRSRLRPGPILHGKHCGPVIRGPAYTLHPPEAIVVPSHERHRAGGRRRRDRL